MPLRHDHFIEFLSAADDAFRSLRRCRNAVPKHAAITALIDDVLRFEEHARRIEQEHGRQQLVEFRDDLEEGNNAGGPVSIEAALEWCDLKASEDELAEAFILSVQKQLNGLHQHAKRVYEAARDEDAISIPTSQSEALPSPRRLICWTLANYVKHRDEWPEDVTKLDPKRQRPTLERLQSTGLLEVFECKGHRLWNAHPRLVSTALGADHDLLSSCMKRLVSECDAYADELEQHLQGNFAGLETELERARREGAERVWRMVRE